MTTGVLSWEQMRFAILLNTGFFETSRYTLDEQMFITSGNWDGAGQSAGNLQYNWGTADRLTELYNHLLNNYESVVISCFAGDTARYNEFRDICLNKTRTEKIAWGETITDYAPPLYGHGLIEPWRTILGTLLQTDECQAKYAEMMDVYYLPNALKLFKHLSCKSRAALGSLFDLSINRGRYYPCNTITVEFDEIDANDALTDAEKEAQKVYQINVHGNDTTNAMGASAADFVPRRMAQANQGGDYHGDLYDPENQFDINQEPAISEKAEAGINVKLGAIDVQNIFLGTTPINKVYLGAELLGGGAIEPFYTSEVPQTQFRTNNNSYAGIGAATSVDLAENQPLWVDVQNWISCRTYYTTDGSTPTENSTVYREALTFTESCTLKVITISASGITSAVKTLTVNVAAASITSISPTETVQNNIPITVTLTNNLGNTIYYKLGATGTQQTYTAPFQVNQTSAGVLSAQIKVTYWSAGEAEKSITYDTSQSIPEAPIVNATGQQGQVALSWAATANTTSYTIYRSTVNGQLGTILAGTQWMTGTSWNDTTAEAGTTYYYTVQAGNYGRATNSAQVSAAPSAAPSGWRYLKIQGYGTSTDLTTRMIEVEAWEGATNRMSAATILSNDATSFGSTNMGTIKDGVKTTTSNTYPGWWVATPNGNVVADLGAQRALTKLNYYGYSINGDQRQNRFKILASNTNDGADWVTLWDMSANTTPQPILPSGYELIL